MSAILEAQGLRKTYRGGDGTPIDLGAWTPVARGEFVASCRQRSCSTLLHLSAPDTPSGIVRPTARATLSRRRNSWPPAKPEDRIRLQFHHPFREFTALEA
jgi:hypothetical protein